MSNATIDNETLAQPTPASMLDRALDEYRNGDSFRNVFHRLVMDDVTKLKRTIAPTVLDIGCGHGFSGDAGLQQSISNAAGRMIGIEPDPAVVPTASFSQLIRGTLEQANLAPQSVQLAYAMFVLEHVQHPAAFWDKLYECLIPGGVFWGFTVDARHAFGFASQAMQRLGIKDTYLNWLKGRRGADRYENYPTFYRANSPWAVGRQTCRFRQHDFLSFHRVGQLDYYWPSLLRPGSRVMERICMALGLPGSILVVRLEK